MNEEKTIATITLPVKRIEAAQALLVLASILNYEYDYNDDFTNKERADFWGEQVPDAFTELVASLGVLSFDLYHLEQGDLWMNDWVSDPSRWGVALAGLGRMIDKIASLRPMPKSEPPTP